MARRLLLQTLLESILGTRAVYFQAPPSTGMVYPCIMYSVDSEKADYADNRTFRRTTRYQITWIGRDPDSTTPGKIADLPMSSFSRRFTSDNLNHVVYNLYF
jgi:hypothetical protein